MVDKTKPISKRNRLTKPELRKLVKLLEEFKFEWEQEFKRQIKVDNWFDFGTHYDAIIAHGTKVGHVQKTIDFVKEEIRRW